jgi:hypothetical protein
MQKLKTDKARLRKFGLTMAAAFAVISLVIFLRGRHSAMPLSAVSLFFLLIGLSFPDWLKYIYIAWMKLAFVLSWVNTRVLLTLVFYLIFSPSGLVMRLLGIDLLKRRLDRSCDSYWVPLENKPFQPADYERQF